MLWLKHIDDMVKFLEVHGRVDWAVVDLEVVLEWLQEQLVVEMIRVSQDELR